MPERKPPVILLGNRGGAYRDARLEWSEPAWLADPSLYDGVHFRRIVAYFLDALLAFVICALIFMVGCTLTIGTLGLLHLPAFLFGTPFIHFVLAAATIGGRRGGTPGMRTMDLKVVAWTGEYPGLLRGIIMPALFYATVPTTGFLILIFGLFDGRGRLLHDHLAGTVVVKSDAAVRL